MRLDHDEEMGPMHGMYGTLDAELDVQRTIKEAQLTTFLCLLRRVVGAPRVMLTTRETLMGFVDEN